MRNITKKISGTNITWAVVDFVVGEFKEVDSGKLVVQSKVENKATAITLVKKETSITGNIVIKNLENFDNNYCMSVAKFIEHAELVKPQKEVEKTNTSKPETAKVEDKKPEASKPVVPSVTPVTTSKPVTPNQPKTGGSKQ